MLCLLFIRQVQFLGKVVDTPLCTMTGVMVQTAVLGQGLVCPLFLRQVHMVPDVQKTFGGAADAVLHCWGRSCDHAALMWCVWRWGCKGFFSPYFFGFFSASSSELRPLPIHPEVLWIFTLAQMSLNNNNNNKARQVCVSSFCVTFC